MVRIEEVAKPSTRPNELLVKVYATTVNCTDCGFRSAVYVISRLFSGFLRPKFRILGSEFAGIVEEAGTDVTLFKTGDRVFGYNDTRFGAHSEFMVVAETDASATIPEGVTFEQAAPITEGAHYALYSKIRRYLILHRVYPGTGKLLGYKTDSGFLL